MFIESYECKTQRPTCTKSGGKSPFSLPFLSSTVNDSRRKLYMVGTHSTVEKRAKRMPDPTVETTASVAAASTLFC